MDSCVTWSELIQVGLFLVGYTSLLYMIFHDHNKKK